VDLVVVVVVVVVVVGAGDFILEKETRFDLLNGHVHPRYSVVVLSTKTILKLVNGSYIFIFQLTLFQFYDSVGQ
jgi:hypothetical protein